MTLIGQKYLRVRLRLLNGLMLQTARGAEKRAKAKKPKLHPRYLEAYRWMLLARLFEDKLASLYRGGHITGGVYVGRGQEAVSVACGMFLQEGDIFAPLIRDQAGRSAFGEPLVDVARTYLGSRLGPMRGRDGNIHRGKPRDGQLAMVSHLGAMISVTVGILLAKKFQGESGFVGLTTIGEGGMQTGATHEGLNIAAVEQVPLVVVATNNHYAYSTPNDREFACTDLVKRAEGYGFEGHSIDGTNLSACLDTIEGAVKRARVGRPPQLVVASVLRLAGHGEHDDASYITDEMKRAPFAQDCLTCAEKMIIDCGLANESQIKEWRTEAMNEVEKAMATAQQEDPPDGDKEDWCAMSMRHLVDPLV